MSTGLLFNCDDYVASHVFQKYRLQAMKYDRAVGLLDGTRLIGAVFFQGWNGYNVEIGYYGPNTVTAGVVRSIGRYMVEQFNPSRLTMITSKRNKHLIRGLQRMGFCLEGMQRRYYGQEDTNRNTGVRLVMFRDRINIIAKLNQRGAA